MKIYGLDFTSAPKHSKPIPVVSGTFYSGTGLVIESLEPLESFQHFEKFLDRSGSCFAGIDMPFGLPVKLLNQLEWPMSWESYVPHVSKMKKSDFEMILKNFKAQQATGEKEPLRITDSLNRAQSPLKLVNPPVARMFYEGAPRLLQSGASILPLRMAKSNCRVIEAYPALLARPFARSYKSTKANQNFSQLTQGRQKILNGWMTQSLKLLGFKVTCSRDLENEAIEDHEGDILDSILCALSAAWAYCQGRPHYGIPASKHPTIKSEGWIVNPFQSSFSLPKG